MQQAARGAFALVLSEGCFFVLGYITVVLLARELGPQLYATYGVILSVLLWLEGAGRRPVPFASAKLLAASTEGYEELERSALALNFSLYLCCFIGLWVMAPWFATWFNIDNGAWLFRLASIDLPLFGLYTASEAIHQGHRRFTRLGLSKVVYAAGKLLGVLIIIYLGISVEKALIMNALSTVGGFAFLISGIHIRWKADWSARMAPLFRLAIPIGLYSFVVPLLSWLNLWILKMMSTSADETMIGVFVGAQNIARVPSFALATLSAVLLPSVSKALAQNDRELAGRYVNQSLRFFLLCYLPACLVLMARPEALMQWIYSETYSGGGLILSLLVVGYGLSTVQAILASILIAADKVKATAALTIVALLPATLVTIGLVQAAAANGAALASMAIPLFAIIPSGFLMMKHCHMSFDLRSMMNIGVAGALMFVIDSQLPRGSGGALLLHAVSLLVYAGALVALREVTWDDLELLRRRRT